MFTTYRFNILVKKQTRHPIKTMLILTSTWSVRELILCAAQLSKERTVFYFTLSTG